MQMENNIKRCSTSYVIRELQIKTTKWFHYMPIRMVKMQNKTLTPPNAGKDAKQQELSFPIG